MIYEKFKLAIADFLEKAGEIPNLVGVIIFGSALTGDVSKKSDIDLLLIFSCNHNPEVSEESKIAREIASEICLKHDLAHSFAFVFFNQKRPQEIELDFLWNIAKEGILIWARPKEIISKKPHPSLEPMLMVKYSIQDLKEKDRRRFLRHLYTSKKSIINKKEERLGPGTLLVKASKFDRIKELFDEFKIKNYSLKKLWGH